LASISFSPFSILYLQNQVTDLWLLTLAVTAGNNMQLIQKTLNRTKHITSSYIQLYFKSPHAIKQKCVKTVYDHDLVGQKLGIINVREKLAYYMAAMVHWYNHNSITSTFDMHICF
jgi:hypothetical protein